MRSIADALLVPGAVALLETIHGETVKVLTGPDAGKSFVATVEMDADAILASQLGEDRRGRRSIHFRIGFDPNIESQEKIELADATVWWAVRKPNNAHLTVDYELIEISTKDS